MDSKPSIRMLMLITTPKLADKAGELFHANAVPVHYRLAARGTASNEMMDILGLGDVDKRMLASLLPKSLSDDILKKLKKALKIGTVNSGIAFTVPLSGVSNLMLRMMQQLDGTEHSAAKEEHKDMKYAMIAAIVNQGYCDDVVAAARAAGARGGTVLHSRSVGEEEAMQVWGLSVQEEKEIVLIVATAEQKHTIMQAIGDKCGVRSPAAGIVLSLPIDNAIGLSED